MEVLTTASFPWPVTSHVCNLDWLTCDGSEGDCDSDKLTSTLPRPTIQFNHRIGLHD